MSSQVSSVRFKAQLNVPVVASSPDWLGVQEGFRSSVVIGSVYHVSCVMECRGTITPGQGGLATIEVIGSEDGVIAPGVHFELKSGPVVAAHGIVESVEFVRSERS